LTKDSADNTHPASFGQEISGADAKFAVQASAGSLMEMELGKLAQQKGSSQAVKNFGTMMVKDHSPSNVELRELAREQHIVVPETLDSKAIELKNKLSGKVVRISIKPKLMP
jgi:putative membrane protein